MENAIAQLWKQGYFDALKPLLPEVKASSPSLMVLESIEILPQQEKNFIKK